MKMATVLEERRESKEGEVQVENGSVESWQSLVLTERIICESEIRNPRNEQQSQEYEIIVPVDDNMTSFSRDFVDSR